MTNIKVGDLVCLKCHKSFFDPRKPYLAESYGTDHIPRGDHHRRLPPRFVLGRGARHQLCHGALAKKKAPMDTAARVVNKKLVRSQNCDENR